MTQSSEPDAHRADDGPASTVPPTQPEGESAENPDAQRSPPPYETPSERTGEKTSEKPHEKTDEKPGKGPVVIGSGPQQLDPRFVTVDRITNWIVAGVIGTILIVYLSLQWTFINMALPYQLATTGGALLVISGLVFRAHWYPVLWHRMASYELSDIAIEIRTGVLFRNVMTVPRSRVQHTDVTQGPLMRRYGVATLVIHTAGTQHAKVSLHGLSRQHADHIRDRLIEHAAKPTGPARTVPNRTTQAAQSPTDSSGLSPSTTSPNATDPNAASPSKSAPSASDPGDAGALRAD